MDSIRDVLKNKARQFDFGRMDDLKIIQLELDRLFDGEARAKTIDSQGIVRIVTDSAAVAGTLRYSQVQLKQALHEQTSVPITKFIIRIGS